MTNTILVTGAAGIVGTALRPVLQKQYQHVILTDLQPVESIASNESYHPCDITDRDSIGKLVGLADGVLHLAGLVGAAYTFDEVLQPNIEGTYNVFRAAYENRISNVVYASSHHVVGFHKRGTHIDDQTPHRPDSHYGLSKAFGESAGAYFADNFGLNVLAVRIGFVGTEVATERRQHTWVSARDLAQLIGIGFETPDLGYEVVYGISGNPDGVFDNSNATRLGYRPEDSSQDHLASEAIRMEQPDLKSVAGGCVGGGFAAVDFHGDAERILR